jgi:glycosyltransferase involved in cell wall biosynthesis
MSRPELSLILPVFNEEAVIPELSRRLREFVEAVGVTWEVVFVDDGSKDRSRDLLRELCAADARFQLVSLSRNFGHQLAITAGLDYAHGSAVVVMDADLQDPPEVVHEMLERFAEGYEVVYGVRRKRHRESIFKRLTAAIFYRVLRSVLGVQVPLDAGDFRLMSRRVVLAMRALRETHRFVRGMVAWVGFRQTAVYYDREARFAGETKYPLRKMLRFAIDGITSFSVLPLRMATWLGLFAGSAATLVGIWLFFVKFLRLGAVPGWTGIMVAVTFGFSAQFVMTGILGEYIGRIYEEIKRRPLYIATREVNLAPLDRDPALSRRAGPDAGDRSP